MLTISCQHADLLLVFPGHSNYSVDSVQEHLLCVLRWCVSEQRQSKIIGTDEDEVYAWHCTYLFKVIQRRNGLDLYHRNDVVVRSSYVLGRRGQTVLEACER